MREFIDVIYDLLNAEKNTGGKLDGIKTITKDPTDTFRPDEFPVIMIGYPVDRPLVNRATGYKLYEAQAGIWVAVHFNKNKKNYIASETSVEAYGDAIQDILLTNPALITTTYPGGFSIRDESTRFGEITTGPDIIYGIAAAVQRLPFQTECLKRNAIIALS